MTAVVTRREQQRLPTAADYEQDRAGMVAALVECGASSVFEIGTVRAPGLSDLDLLACFDGPPTAATCAPVTRFLASRPPSFLHPPWALFKAHLPLLPDLFAIRQLRTLHGHRALAVAQRDSQRLLWNVEACASVLGVLRLRAGRASERSALCLLHGITYNVMLAGEDGIHDPCGPEFVQRIGALRSGWFAADPIERGVELQQLWQLASALLHGLLAGYASTIASRLGAPRATRLLLPIPGARLLYGFGAPPPPRALALPFAETLWLPAGLQPLFERLAAPGNGLDRWLRPRPRVRTAATATAPDLAFAAEVDRYARANARYLGDVLPANLPFLVLNGGTLAHLGGGPQPALWRRLARAPRRLLRLVRGGMLH